METKKTTKKQNPKVTFEDCNTVGDEIKALVGKLTGRTLGGYILERALEEVKENDKKLEEFKAKLLGGK